MPMAVKNPRKDSMVLSLPDPKQAGDAEIDLIDQRQVLVPFGVLDFVDADGVDLAEHPVLQPEGDDVFDGVEDLVPGSAERFAPFPSTKAGAPSGPETACRLWLGCVCHRPRELPRPRPRSGGNRRAAWSTAGRPKIPRKE